MAVLNNYKLTTGHVIPNAYIRIGKLEVVRKVLLRYTVAIFYDQSEEFPAEEILFMCPYDIEGENPIAQAYTHMKTLPEFAGAVDC